MKKFLLLITLIVLSIGIGLSWKEETVGDNLQKLQEKPKQLILRFALIADSEDEDELLAKALSQAKGAGVNFVIGLGDFTSLGIVEQLTSAKNVFDQSGLTYYVTAGDRDLWDSRNRGEVATANFRQVFGDSSFNIIKEGIQIVILDNSDIYKGIDQSEWSMVNGEWAESAKLRFVFAHKTLFHPQSSHVMGEGNDKVSAQARKLMDLLEEKRVDGFFSGDLHFFARFNSPSGAVKMTTIGAVNSARNFQGPRFAIVTVYSDYSWEVEDVEIR